MALFQKQIILYKIKLRQIITPHKPDFFAIKKEHWKRKLKFH